MKYKEDLKINLVWFISCIIVLIYLIFSMTSLVLPLLRTGYHDGPGMMQTGRVLTGIALLFVVPSIALASCIYLKYYYQRASKKNILINKLVYVNGIQILFIPIYIVINNIIRRRHMLSLDWIIISIGIVVASILIYISKIIPTQEDM
ncbi:hypothetical protein [Natronospora cellulosivora (SeqCode)]